MTALRIMAAIAVGIILGFEAGDGPAENATMCTRILAGALFAFAVFPQRKVTKS